MQFRQLFMLLSIPGMAMAAEGMWTLDNLPASRMASEIGFAPDSGWVQHVMRSTALYGDDCTAAFVSKDGLMMTNHHCVSQCIDQLSTAQQNYLQDGFLAQHRERELRCPGLELDRLEQITDVSDKVKRATTGLEGQAFQKAQNAIKAQLVSACIGADTAKTRCDVVDLYHGGRYHLYRYHRFTDTRLVWAPEKAIAFFGGDPDNFNFPRYDLDMTLVRVYENGTPAAIQDYFKFAPAGIKDGDAVFVAGHPGSTQRQLTVAQLETLRDVILPDALLSVAESRGVLEQYSKESAEAKRTTEEHLFFVENSYKVLSGQIAALRDPELMRNKQEDEAALRQYVAAKPELLAKVGDPWSAIASAQTTYRKIAKPYRLVERGDGFDSIYFRFARVLVRAAQEREKPSAARLAEFDDARLPSMEAALFSDTPVYPAFEQVKLSLSLTKLREKLGVDHPLVKRVLGKMSPDQLSSALIGHTRLGDPAVRKSLWAGGHDAIAHTDDAFIRLALAIDDDARALRTRYEGQVESVVQKNAELIALARFDKQGTSTYPDATLTLRLSYGQVKGWDEPDHHVAAFTTVGGAFERDTGAEPFALPTSWHRAKSLLEKTRPMNFVTTNDITGGNSGSPMLNRRGEIIGLVFDTNIHALGGAYWYDPRVNRTVGIDAGMILDALQHVYHADGLVKEISAP